jgi:hypothetical protein
MSRQAPDQAEEVDANKRRLAVLGDSTAFVFGFIALKAMGRQLTKALNSPGKSFQTGVVLWYLCGLRNDKTH